MVRDLERELHRILRDEATRQQFNRIATESSDKIWDLLKENPHIVKIAEEVRRIKEESIERLEELIEKAKSSIERNKGVVYLAKDAEEARKIIGDIIGSDRIIVKAKSMATEEIGLNEYLESLGKEVWETDLGMFLVQILRERPSHPIAPAIHLTRERIVEGLRRIGIKVSIDSSPEEIASAVREFLRKKIFSADVGISGANALAADTGSIVLVENESNIRLVTSVPKKHIALVPVDKIVPTLEDALKVAIVQAAYDGLYPPTYISVITGPSSTADIEHKRVYGAQGPKELHVVMLDNGRIKTSRDQDFKQILRCIRCGRCVFECPVYQAIGYGYGYKNFNGPMGVVWLYVLGYREEAGYLSTLCTHAGNCREVCPVKIDLPYLINKIKRDYIRRIVSG
ncbi:MAG: LUD domain-containing protein [Sulfolobales archaeon]|jgi:L-lactate dehydrogenase complex protein LldG